MLPPQNWGTAWSGRVSEHEGVRRPWSQKKVPSSPNRARRYSRSCGRAAAGACAGRGGGVARRRRPERADVVRRESSYGEQDQEVFAEQSRRVEELVVAAGRGGREYLPWSTRTSRMPGLHSARGLSPGVRRSTATASTPGERVGAGKEFTTPQSSRAMGQPRGRLLPRALRQRPISARSDRGRVVSTAWRGCQGERRGGLRRRRRPGGAHPGLEKCTSASGRPPHLEANAAWSGCMSEAGYSYANQEEIYGTVRQQNALYEGPTTKCPRGPAETPRRVRGDGLARPGRRVRGRRYAIAVADQTAGRATPTELEREVNVEYEEAFIEENRSPGAVRTRTRTRR